MMAVLINNTWEKIPKFKYCLEKFSQFQKFFGNNFIGKKYCWEKIQLEIFSQFWRKFPLVKISLEKNSPGNNFCWKKFHLGKISCFFKSLDKNALLKTSVGQKFLRNYFFGKNYLGKISFGNKPLDIFTLEDFHTFKYQNFLIFH